MSLTICKIIQKLTGQFHRQERKRCLFIHGCGGPNILILRFYSTLERFLQLGPVGPQRFPFTREISIQTLDLNFVSPANPDDMFPQVFSESYGNSYHGGFPWYEHRPTKPDGSGYLMRPETLLLWQHNYIDQMLGLGYHASLYGKLLYERIGRIRFLVDGKLHSEIDIAAKFAELTMSQNLWKVESPNRREDVWEAWRKKTYRKRVKLGLPVVEDESLHQSLPNPVKSSREETIFGTHGLPLEIYTGSY